MKESLLVEIIRFDCNYCTFCCETHQTPVFTQADVLLNVKLIRKLALLYLCLVSTFVFFFKVIVLH